MESYPNSSMCSYYPGFVGCTPFCSDDNNKNIINDCSLRYEPVRATSNKSNHALILMTKHIRHSAFVGLENMTFCMTNCFLPHLSLIFMTLEVRFRN
jgi:hypothetical protein